MTQQRQALVKSVLNAIHSLQESAGSSVKQIVDFIKCNPSTYQRSAPFRQLTAQVRNVLRHGVVAGYLKTRNYRYQLDLAHGLASNPVAQKRQQRRGETSVDPGVEGGRRRGRNIAPVAQRSRQRRGCRERGNTAAAVHAGQKRQRRARGRDARSKRMKRRPVTLRRAQPKRGERRRSYEEDTGMDGTSSEEDVATGLAAVRSARRQVKALNRKEMRKPATSGETSHLLISTSRPTDAPDAPMDSDSDDGLDIDTSITSRMGLSQEDLDKLFTKHAVTKMEPDDVVYLPPVTSPTVTLLASYTGRVTRSMTRRAQQACLETRDQGEQEGSETDEKEDDVKAEGESDTGDEEEETKTKVVPEAPSAPDAERSASTQFSL